MSNHSQVGVPELQCVAVGTGSKKLAQGVVEKLECSRFGMVGMNPCYVGKRLQTDRVMSVSH